jgi:hypothetical protein
MAVSVSEVLTEQKQWEPRGNKKDIDKDKQKQKKEEQTHAHPKKTKKTNSVAFSLEANYTD